jgi:hypothetical protein
MSLPANCDKMTAAGFILTPAAKLGPTQPELSLIVKKRKLISRNENIIRLKGMFIKEHDYEIRRTGSKDKGVNRNRR